MTYQIIGLGEILWDMFPAGKKLGGAPANFAYHAKAISQGRVDTFIASSIGDDSLGKAISAALHDLKINQNHLAIDSRHPTGTVTVELDQQGSPTYTIDQDVAWDYIPTIARKLAESIDAVCFGTLAQRSPVSRNSIQQFLSEVPDSALKIFDINLRQSYYSLEVISKSLQLANVLKINDEEIGIVSRLLDINATDDSALQEIVNRYGLKLGILTKGGNGSTLISGDQISSFPGIDVPVQDSVGAGDAFTAAIAVGILQGYDLDHLNAYANKLAAFVCTSTGATPSIPDEIFSLFKEY